MFTKDENNLEKFIDFHVMIPELDFERWDVVFKKLVVPVLEIFNLDPTRYEYSNFVQCYSELSCLLQPILRTPRSIKSFARHLSDKLNKPTRNLNFIDLFCLTAIQATNPRLHTWLSGRRIYLIDWKTSSSEAVFRKTYQRIVYGVDSDENTQKENWKRVEKELDECNFCSEYEKVLVKYIFFANIEDISLRIMATDRNKRVTENQYFCNYFYRDRVTPLGTDLGERELIDKLTDETVGLDQILEILRINFESCAKREDLEEFVAKKIEELIKSLDTKIAAKLLISYGMLEKQSKLGRDAAYIQFDYLNRLRTGGEKLDALKTIMKASVTDKMKTTIIFSLKRRDEGLNEGDIPLDGITELCRLFIEYCNTSFINPIIKNIFEESDSPWQVLYRLVDAKGDKTVVEPYLIQLFERFPSAILEFLREFMPNYFHTFKEKSDNLYYFISPDKLKEIVDSPSVASVIQADHEVQSFVAEYISKA